MIALSRTELQPIMLNFVYPVSIMEKHIAESLHNM
jgi:hypothetical protein